MPGGVCEVLDYEVDLMADYVSEMALRVVFPQKNVNSTFRKFVSQILTSTRLPSTTILLGMNYLAKRVNMMQSAGRPAESEGQVWRMVTVALLLGSKFLDDNTFQNKSWSEVSGIPVQELNNLETEWLATISWTLFVNLDTSEDYQAWLANWKEWLDTKKLERHQPRTRLIPLKIDTDVARARKVETSWHTQQVAEYERLSSMKRNTPPSALSYRRDHVQVYPAQSWTANPLTPPDSGYGTPEYPNSATWLNSRYNDWFDRAVVSGPAPRAPYGPQQYSAYQRVGVAPRHPANYQSFYPYNPYPWEHLSGSECNCANCNNYHKPQQYFHACNYGQPVAG